MDNFVQIQPYLRRNEFKMNVDVIVKIMSLKDGGDVNDFLLDLQENLQRSTLIYQRCK